MSSDWETILEHISRMQELPPHRRTRNQVADRFAKGSYDSAKMLLAIYDLLDERLPPPPMKVIGEPALTVEDDKLRGPCLICSRLGTHRFAAVSGPDGWLCEEHKDDPVYGFGEKGRRTHPDE